MNPLFEIFTDTESFIIFQYLDLSTQAMIAFNWKFPINQLLWKKQVENIDLFDNAIKDNNIEAVKYFTSIEPIPYEKYLNPKIGTKLITFCSKFGELDIIILLKNKGFKPCRKSMLVAKNVETMKLLTLDISNKWLCLHRDSIDNIIEKQDMEMCKYVFDHKEYLSISKEQFKRVIETGNIEMTIYLSKKVNFNPLIEAAKYSNIEIINHIFRDRFGYGFRPGKAITRFDEVKAMKKSIAETFNKNVVEWYQKNVNPENISTFETSALAGSSGEFFRLILKENFPADVKTQEDIFYNAVIGGNLDIIQYLLDIECKYFFNVISAAKTIKVLDFLLKKGHKLTEEFLYELNSRDNIELLEFAIKVECWDPKKYVHNMYFNNKKVLLWLRNNDHITPEDYDKYFEMSFKEDEEYDNQHLEYIRLW